MRDHVAICLRMMTGHGGAFSAEMEAFWREVERQYRSCNVMMIPQNHIPLWYQRAMDQGIPLVAAPKGASAPVADAPTDSLGTDWSKLTRRPGRPKLVGAEP